MISGLFTSIPSEPSTAYISSSVILEILSLRFKLLYSKPLVLKNFLRGKPLCLCHFFNSAADGLFSLYKPFGVFNIMIVQPFFGLYAGCTFGIINKNHKCNYIIKNLSCQCKMNRPSCRRFSVCKRNRLFLTGCVQAKNLSEFCFVKTENVKLIFKNKRATD